MKRTNLILSVGILLTLSSCNKYETYQNESYQPASSLQVENRTDPNYLGLHMQWVSFIITEILMNDTDDEFRSDIVKMSLNGSVSLKELFQSKDFEDEFKNLLIEEWKNPEVPTRSKNKPPQAPSGDDGLIEEIVDQFINYITTVECLEIYFPVTLNFDGSFDITSTAHPLNNELGNIGYINYGVPYYHFQFGLTETDEVFVDLEYVEEYGNVIVTRPDQLDAGCDYSQYNIDFTEFLSL